MRFDLGKLFVTETKITGKKSKKYWMYSLQKDVSITRLTTANTIIF